MLCWNRRLSLKNYGLDCFADDTGLEVEALDGAPGVYSARYAGGEGHDAQANMLKLLHELEGKEIAKHNSVLPFRWYWTERNIFLKEW